MSKDIKHPGTVLYVEPDLVKVKIIAISACAKCHAKGACTASDMEDKIIDIHTKDYKEYSPGQEVTVVMQKELGAQAVFIGYVFPLVFLVIVLLFAGLLVESEAMVGLIALFSLVPYYIIVYLFRKKIEKRFVFKILNA